jgi:hypothetical protein
MSELNKIAFINEELEWWTAYVQDRLKFALERRKIKVSEELMKSIDADVRNAAQEAQGAAALSFKTHGRFVDMGAGRGYRKGVPTSVAVRERLQDKRGRRPKKWYSKVAYGTVNRLIERLLSRYQEHVIYGVKNILEDKP